MFATFSPTNRTFRGEAGNIADDRRCVWEWDRKVEEQQEELHQTTSWFLIVTTDDIDVDDDGDDDVFAFDSIPRLDH